MFQLLKLGDTSVADTGLRAVRHVQPLQCGEMGKSRISNLRAVINFQHLNLFQVLKSRVTNTNAAVHDERLHVLQVLKTLVRDVLTPANVDSPTVAQMNEVIVAHPYAT